MLVIEVSGSVIYALFNLVGCQQDINKIYLHSKDPYEAKY